MPPWMMASVPLSVHHAFADGPATGSAFYGRSRGWYRAGMSESPELLRAYLKIAPLSRALIRSRELELIADHGLQGRLLDLGHGDGHFAEILARAGVRIDVAMDISPEELQRARGKTDAHLVVGDMERLPFRRGAFDATLSNCVLEHVVDIDSAFREAAAILKPGGVFLTTVVTDRYELLLFWPRLLGRIGLRPLALRYLAYLQDRFVHRRYIPASSWVASATAAGFEETGRRYYAGPLRQMLMDLGLPGIQLGRIFRSLIGVEVISFLRWPAAPIRRWLMSEDADSDPRRFANVMLSLRKRR